MFRQKAIRLRALAARDAPLPGVVAARHSMTMSLPIKEFHMSLFDISERAQQLQNELLDFMESHVYPAEAVYEEQMRESGRPALPAADPRGAQGRGPKTRPVEPLSPAPRHRRGSDEPRIRAAGRDHGPQLHRPRGVQLQRPRHRQHGGARAVRHRRAPGEVPQAAAGGHHEVRVRDDRAAGGQLGRHQRRAVHGRATATTTCSTVGSGSPPTRCTRTARS